MTWGTYFDTILQPDIKDEGDFRERNALDPFAAYSSRESHWESRYLNPTQGYCLRPGKRGGIIEMACHLEASAGRDRIDNLIFLAAPDDLEESYPEDRALVRSALRNNSVLLPTFTTAAHWLAYETDLKPGDSADLVQIKGPPENSKLALIAHDEKKMDLCRWVVTHCAQIQRFEGLLTTGTTGERVREFLGAVGIPPGKIEQVDSVSSGPSGGDIEIAGAILRGECQHVVFFVDPMTSHAHEGDIQALVRTCSLPDVRVNLRLNKASADSWINTIEPITT